MASRTAVLNPAPVKVTLYMPIGSVANWNRPGVVVIRVCGLINAGLVSVTVTLGTGAPALSVTVPKMVARGLCKRKRTQEK